METLKKLRILNGNTLKIIAAVLMVIDHVGFLLFPNIIALRLIGRPGYPLFVFTFAEGCKYTKNKRKHFLMIFVLAVICQLVYYFFANSLYMCILVPFSLATLMIYAMQYCKKCLLEETEHKLYEQIFSVLLFLGTIAGTYVFCQFFDVDYRFSGCMFPVIINLFDFRGISMGEGRPIEKLDCFPMRIACVCVGLIGVCVETVIVFPSVALYVPFYFLAIPLLLMYNEQKGKANLKYFFYLFYPLHLVLIEGIYLLTLLVNIPH